MAQPKVYEGTWEELSSHAEEFRSCPKLTLIVPPQEQHQEPALPHDTAVEEFRRQGLRGYGRFKGMLGGSEALAREKQEDLAREERKRL